MKYGIIAAGEGSRLAAEGVTEPKPLVTINGEHLIDRLIRVFMENDAESITVICNENMTQVGRHLKEIISHGLNGQHIPLELVVKTTPSSMHSFYEISKHLQGGTFCLTTVDTIFREKDFSAYIKSLQQLTGNDNADGVMAVTSYIDDEKPLYVATDSELNITAFSDTKDRCRYVSGGIYGLTSKSIDVLNDCIAQGNSRMRNFQRALVSNSLRLKAMPFDKILDIDHASDIIKAETFLRENS